jgi:DnaJ-domain-containing protein 1
MIQQDLLPQYEALVGRARAAKPEAGSANEHELVRELATLLFDVLERLGPHALAYLRGDVQGQLDELVRRAYRKALLQYHPDKLANDLEKQKAATEVTRRLTEAYNGLKRYLGG